MASVVGKNVYIDVNTFSNNTNIKSVDLCNVPFINNSMANAFFNCSNLTTITNINQNTTDLYRTFYNCSSIINTPTIPNSVTNIASAFDTCINLTGNIYIQTTELNNVANCFKNTSLQKNVYIPFQYDNSINTQTYNSFIEAGYDEIGTQHGVYLKDVVTRVRINPTPSNATVLMIDRTVGANVSFDGWTYTNTANDYEIQTYTGSNTEVVVPSIYTTTNSMRVDKNDVVEYIVYKDGYESISNTITITDSEIVNVTLEPIMCTFRIEPIPSDATVTLTAPGYSQSGNSITVPCGTRVLYNVSKSNYQTVSETEIVKTSGSKFIPLSINKHRFTINASPTSAVVQILVNGKLVNASSDDWIFTADNVNGDIELQDYIGTNTDVTMPTEYIISTNSVLAEYGSTISYKVTYNGQEETGTLTLTQDTSIDVGFDANYTVDDYTYTLSNNTLTLTKYNGAGGDIIVPIAE